jgi:chromate reductase, NAD(P)H dehydrogenase (quinone)
VLLPVRARTVYLATTASNGADAPRREPPSYQRNVSQPNEIRILGIAGSLRRGSFNRGLLRAAHELSPPDMQIETFDRLGEIPPYNEDVEVVGKPEPVRALVDAVRAADGLLVVTPEYNYSIPGVLKNAIDWVSRPPKTTPLKGKPAAIMSASIGISGGMRAQYHLRQAFVFTETQAMLKPEVIIPKAAERFDSNGRLVDESTRELIRGFLVAFGEWTRRMSVVAVLLVALGLGACSHVQLRSPIATGPALDGPPPTFVQTTSDTRSIRVIDVAPGQPKPTLFKEASDLLAQKFSVDVSDPKAGFLMTPWQSNFMRGGVPDLHYRTRVIVRFIGDDWKQVSVRAEANWQHADEWDIGLDTKLLDDVSNELAARVGKK